MDELDSSAEIAALRPTVAQVASLDEPAGMAELRDDTEKAQVTSGLSHRRAEASTRVVRLLNWL